MLGRGLCFAAHRDGRHGGLGFRVGFGMEPLLQDKAVRKCLSKSFQQHIFRHRVGLANRLQRSSNNEDIAWSFMGSTVDGV